MIIPEGYAQINYIFSGANFSRGAQVTLGLQNTISDLNAGAVATAAATAWENNLLPLQVDSLTLVEVRAKLGPNETGPEATEPVGVAGGESDTPLPPNVATLVKKVTDQGGRKNRGRFFLPGMSELAILNDGNYDPAILATLNAALGDFYADLVAADLEPVVLHTDILDSPTDINALVAQSKVATQKRRLRKVGGRRNVED